VRLDFRIVGRGSFELWAYAGSHSTMGAPTSTAPAGTTFVNTENEVPGSSWFV